MDFSVPEVKRDTPSVLARFYMKAVHNAFKSEQEGRPIYDQREYVEITVAGDTRTTVDRAVKAEDKERWPQAYARFKEGQEEVLSGTPLANWPALNTAQVAEFKALKIHTVEQLASLDDGRVGHLGTGGMRIREKAKAFLEQAEKGAPLSAALQKNEDLEAQLKVKDAAIGALQAEVERLKSKVVEGAR